MDKIEEESFLADTQENRQKFFESFDLPKNVISITGSRILDRTHKEFGKQIWMPEVLESFEIGSVIPDANLTISSEWVNFGRLILENSRDNFVKINNPNREKVVQDIRNKLPSERIRELCRDPGVYTVDGIIKYLDEQFRKRALDG